MLRTVLLLVGNDLRLFFRDRVAVLLGFALPIALVGIFGFVMGAIGGGGGDGGVQAVDVAVADEDGSPASAAFVAALRDSGLVQPISKEQGRFSREELRARLDEGKDAFALAIPPGFADGADLVLLRDPGRDMEWPLVQMGLATALFRARGADAAWEMTQRSLHAAGLPDAWRARIEGLMGPFRMGMESMFSEAERDGHLGGDEPGDPLAFFEQALPLTVQDVVPEGRDRQLTYMVSHAVSGMTVMMLMFTLVGCARSLLEERARGTLRRLLAAPIDARAILLAKFVSGWVLGLVLIVVLYTFAWAVFDVDVASRWGTLLVVSMATAAACTSFAMLIAAWARTDKQADGVSTLLILTMSALGGAWFPAMIMPPAAKLVAKFTLTYWSLSGYQASLWYGRHWTDAEVLLPVGVVLAVALGLGLLAAAQFRRRYLAG
jgi:ABC-2 type transport system permease protein